MYKFKAELSYLFNNYIGKEHEFGQNDCNILIADYLDTFFSTDYASKLKGQYTTIKEGVSRCEALVGYKTVIGACEKHLKRSDDIETGSVLVKKHSIGKKVYYTATIVFDNQALVEYQNKYTLTNYKEVEYDFIFNRG